MAGEVETQGQLQDFLAILKKRRWQILIPALLIFSLGCAVAVIVPRKYVVETTIEIRPVQLGERTQRPGQDSAVNREVGNAVHHVKNPRRVAQVLEEVGGEEFPKDDPLQRKEYLDKVRDNIAVTVLEKNSFDDGGSDFVTIEYKDVDRLRAVQFLNRLAALWVEEVIDRDRLTLREEMDVYQDRLREVTQQRQKMGNERIEIIREFDLSTNEILTGTRILQEDPILQGLQHKENEQLQLELEIGTQRLLIAELQEEFDLMPEYHSDTETIGGDEGGLDTQIQSQKIKIEQLIQQQERYRPASIKWQVLEDMKEQAQQMIALLTAHEVEESIAVVEIANEERLELGAEIRLQEKLLKEKTRGLEVLGRQLEVMASDYQERIGAAKEVEELRADIELLDEEVTMITRGLNVKELQLEILNEAHGSPYEITEEAIPPRAPSEPNPFVIVAFALVAGLALGLGLALLSEYSKNCFRTVGDVAKVMSVPVLGVVSTIVTRAELRRRRTHRLIVGISSAVVIGGIAWFSYAYAFHGEWLGTDLRAQIEELRMKLR